jgi:hypothetical protein
MLRLSLRNRSRPVVVISGVRKLEVFDLGYQYKDDLEIVE